MTGGQFREVDFDLLADYVGGALDGTPDGATVARLVVEEPAWARAHAALARGVESVGAALANWGADPLPMPADVLDRLTAALTQVDQLTEVDPAGPADTIAALDTTELSGPRLVAVPGSEVPGRGRKRGGPSAGRRRWTRLAGPVTIAAAVAVLGGVGLSQLHHPGGADTTASTWYPNDSGAESGAPDSPTIFSGEPDAAALAVPSATRTLVSGTNYTPDTLVQRVRALGVSATSGGGHGIEANVTGQPVPGTAVDGGLARLADHGALDGCFDAVAAVHAQEPLAVELVDYAAFEGAPALVVVFTDPSGTRWAWVTGPECGRAGFGADVRYQIRVG